MNALKSIFIDKKMTRDDRRMSDYVKKGKNRVAPLPAQANAPVDTENQSQMNTDIEN